MLPVLKRMYTVLFPENVDFVWTTGAERFTPPVIDYTCGDSLI